MGKIAFVFAGQGAQYPGMGEKLCAVSKAAAAVMKVADAVRPGTYQQCLTGTPAELQQTSNTQPCMFAVEMAAAAALTEAGIHADMAAGFSLGEIAALTYVQAVDLESGFKLVCRRGELMQRAAEHQSTAMAAVLKIDASEVERICQDFDQVYPVNYNCPGQTTVAGPDAALEPLGAAIKAAGGRLMRLKVGGGFHSPFMADAANAFAEELGKIELQEPQIPLYSDLTGEPYCGDMRALLSKQICSPVRWEKIVRNMIADGADTFIELGPGKVLSGLISRIDPSVRVFSVEDDAGLNAVIAEVKPC